MHPDAWTGLKVNFALYALFGPGTFLAVSSRGGANAPRRDGDFGDALGAPVPGGRPLRVVEDETEGGDDRPAVTGVEALTDPLADGAGDGSGGREVADGAAPRWNTAGVDPAGSADELAGAGLAVPDACPLDGVTVDDWFDGETPDGGFTVLAEPEADAEPAADPVRRCEPGAVVPAGSFGGPTTGEGASNSWCAAACSGCGKPPAAAAMPVPTSTAVAAPPATTSFTLREPDNSRSRRTSSAHPGCANRKALSAAASRVNSPGVGGADAAAITRDNASDSAICRAISCSSGGVPRLPVPGAVISFVQRLVPRFCHTSVSVNTSGLEPISRFERLGKFLQSSVRRGTHRSRPFAEYGAR